MRQLEGPKPQLNHNPSRKKVSCNICNWWKKEEEGTRKFKISFCNVSCHKTELEETTEDEE